MQTGTMQRCNDTETDPRPDAESCRLLGVRSILMLPLEDEKGRFGILEVFSPIANAFGDADVAILQSLARRAVQNKRAADEGTAMLENPQDGKHLLAEAELRELDLPGPEAPRDETGQRTTDLLTTILGVIVICAAVLLNLLIVRRAREVRIALRRPVVVASTQPEQNAPLTPAQNYGSQVKKSIPCNTAPAPTGGLVVREDGRVVFWQAPSQTTPRNAQDHK